jgi:mono/diheme cytochrome c family protein
VSRRALLPLVAGLVTAAVVFAAFPRDDDPPARPAAAAAAPAPSEGRAVFTAMGCGSCHAFDAAGSTADFGPDLDERVRNHTAESLRATIVDPPESIMPEDFGRRMNRRQLDALVAFLLAGRG